MRTTRAPFPADAPMRLTRGPAVAPRRVRAAGRALRIGACICAALVAAGCAGPSLRSPLPQPLPPPPMIDAHAHYTAADAAALSPAEIVAALDASGVARVVVSGTPPALAQALHRHAPQRVVPFLGVYASEAGKALWMHDAALPGRVAEQLRSGHWAGLGELHLFARDAGSPVFAALVRLAAERDLVLLIHGDAEVVDRAFALAPRVRVLWAHLGTEPLPEAVQAVLERHRGRALWVDTSVRDERIAPGGVLLPAWRTLFERHPERFVVAVDAFSTQRWRRYGEVVAAIRTWVGALPAPLARRLLHENAAAMLEPAR